MPLKKLKATNKLSNKATPIIHKREFARRRRDLMAQMEPNSIAILPSAASVIRNRDAEFKFRQDSDFHYLSGFNEPDAVLLLIPGRKHGQCVFFCRERDPERELWDGYRQGPEGLCANFGADDAFPISDIDDILPGLLEGRERVYYSMGKRPEFDKRLMDWINVLRSKARSGAHPPGEFLDLDHLLHDMRLYKSAAELRIMRNAATISAAAHTRAMQVCQPGMMEYQLEAEYLHEFAKNGAQAAAYNSIVGAGKNACILHYVENNAVIRDGDLVLIDAGCELNCYAADITRTFPANGCFSKEQQALYEIVLASQLAAIETIKPGNHWNQSHDKTVQVITQGLLDLGILKGNVNELIEKEAYKPFYMHRAGHWLGMDVHDVGDYKVHDEWRVLEPGMVMTVEPGIYIAADNKDVAAKWRGIGIRIEDDVVVTGSGHDVMTCDVVKTVDDIHALMRPSTVSKNSHPAQIDFITSSGFDRESDKASASSKTETKSNTGSKATANVKAKAKPEASVKAKKKAKSRKKLSGKIPVRKKLVKKKAIKKTATKNKTTKNKVTKNKAIRQKTLKKAVKEKATKGQPAKKTPIKKKLVKKKIVKPKAAKPKPNKVKLGKKQAAKKR